MEFKDLQPLGFIETDIKKAVYYKEDVIAFLKSKYSQQEVEEYYDKYWKNNKEIIIIIGNKNYHIYDTQEINEMIKLVLENQKNIENFL